MVTTPSMVEFLSKRGFKNLMPWARGVNTELFNPNKRFSPEDVYAGLPRPVFVNVGRVAVEKNIGAFLELDLPGSKVVVGAGPQLEQLKRKFPDVHFLGAKFDDELARYFADANVFVFPSKTDTFGLVILEAMATGTPVAAFPVTGPIDIIPGSGAGVVNEDLRQACLDCLNIERALASAHAQNYSWETVTDIFYDYLTPEYEPNARRRWRRLRRMMRLAGSPYHIIKKTIRWFWRFLRGKSYSD